MCLYCNDILLSENGLRSKGFHQYESLTFDAVMQFLQISGLDGEDDGVVTFVQLEGAVLRMGQVNRIVLPGMEEDVFNDNRIIIYASVAVGDFRDVLDDDDRLILPLH